jgi:hypothetical protein
MFVLLHDQAGGSADEIAVNMNLIVQMKRTKPADDGPKYTTLTTVSGDEIKVKEGIARINELVSDEIARLKG